ncbi:DNA-formamidopyrimidine glycosylase family protein [Zhihengliuella sp.]|uniref:Fpg/Nei family DNA glycosylase n=1 Tax=Zhihengliuella sp. TaxID=1954483 RepID=UPI0028126F08|nr:DNA-formamidopyrimidine glycosylase family protein [Zhihengliuella sp.]
MPEGHSIHRLARQFTDVFGGRRVAVTSPQGRFADGAARLDGRTLLRGSAHGKQLFVEFDGGLHLRVHLGLYGAFSFGGDEQFAGASSIGAPRRIGEREDLPAEPAVYRGPPEPVGQVRVRLVTEHGWADLRGASVCEVLTPAEVDAVRARLGPDPLRTADEGRAAAFHRRLRTRTGIGVALMDQSRVAGVGNIYRAESLFRCRIDPLRPSAELDSGQLDRLWDDLCELMAAGVREGRIVTTDPADRPDPQLPVWPEQAYYVYQRAGRECRRCGSVVQVAEVAGRKLYWCPGCQGD